MAYNVTKLITNAWYLSGIVSRQLQTLSGDQLSDGLDLLNALLAMKTADDRLIPYFTSYPLTAVIGQESYAIPGLISVETITFNLQTIVRFPMQQLSRKQYFGTYRVNNINSLPFSCHIERSKGGATLYVYYLPNDNYPITITGKFSLGSFSSFTTDLELTLDKFYIEYLRYALAALMCDEYAIAFSPRHQATLDKYEEKLLDLSPLDLSVSKISSFGRGSNINWGYVNFPGWSA
jgi:hypothetical protein